MTLLEKMNQENLFSGTEQKVADYLFEHMNEAAEMTIDQLAKATYTSNASIVRMCQKLGYKGFKAFRIQFVKEAESSKYLVDTVDYDMPFGGMDDPEEIIAKLASLYKESIDLCLQRLDPVVIRKVAYYMMKSKRIFIFAEGDTMFTVKGFMNKLLKLNIYPILASETYEDVATCCNVTKDDCVLFISYSMKSRRYEECYRILRSSGAKIMAITANEEHVITRTCDEKVILAKRESNTKIATFYSQFVIGYTLNILYSLIYSQDYKKYNEHKHKIDRLNI